MLAALHSHCTSLECAYACACEYVLSGSRIWVRAAAFALDVGGRPEHVRTALWMIRCRLSPEAVEDMKHERTGERRHAE